MEFFKNNNFYIAAQNISMPNTNKPITKIKTNK